MPGKKLLFQFVCFCALVYAHIFFSYDFHFAWWFSVAGLVFITALGLLIWREHFLYVSGLKIPSAHFFPVVITALTVLVIGWSTMSAVGDDIQITLNSPLSYAHNVFYIICEEMVLGAMMLYFLTARFKLREFQATVLMSFLVAVLHFIFYKWVFRDHGMLEAATLCSLFLTALIKNNLIVRFGHIGFAWAVHFGWMAVMFGSEHYRQGVRLTDLDKFNLYLGSNSVVLITLVLATLSFVKKETALPALQRLRKR